MNSNNIVEQNLAIITYVSSSRELMTDEALNYLLKTCREHNLKKGITGLLLYKDGNFMQTLEGPKDFIREVFQKIKIDSRHKDIATLLDEPIEKRSFDSWAMAFQNLNYLSAKEVPGYSEFFDKPLTSDLFQDDPSAAQRLLLIFRKLHR